jgi:hypothetical protein
VEELTEKVQQAHNPQIPRGPRAEVFGVYLLTFVTCQG